MKAINRTGVDYYCQISDVELLKKIVVELPDNPMCVNIGAGMGTSALAMLEARPDSQVMSVDIDEHALNDERNLVIDAGIDLSRYHPVISSSHDAGKQMDYFTVDFVFVDGDHTYEGCYNDALIWYNALKHSGIMAFHDYGAVMLATVKPAVDDVTQLLSMQKETHNGTLIVFRKV